MDVMEAFRFVAKTFAIAYKNNTSTYWQWCADYRIFGINHSCSRMQIYAQGEKASRRRKWRQSLHRSCRSLCAQKCNDNNNRCSVCAFNWVVYAFNELYASSCPRLHTLWNLVNKSNIEYVCFCAQKSIFSTLSNHRFVLHEIWMKLLATDYYEIGKKRIQCNVLCEW